MKSPPDPAIDPGDGPRSSSDGRGDPREDGGDGRAVLPWRTVAVWRRIRTVSRLWRLYWLRVAVRLAPTETQRLFALTMVVGAACGLVAVAFHLSIQLAEHLMIERAMAASGIPGVIWTILTPVLGGLVAGALLEYVVPYARGSGIPQVKVAFSPRGRQVRFRDAVGKFVVGTIQIGSGASLGREGPTVHICAGVATVIGRLARVSPRSLRRLLPVAAAAGIAAAFNAPIAAVTFTIEEVVGDLDKTVLSGVIIAAALAAVIERSVLGEHPVFSIPSGYGLHHSSSLLLYALLGIAAGLVALAFTESLLGLRLWFRRFARAPNWTKPAFGGLATGVLAVIALQLHTGGVTGGGYSVLADALAGRVALKMMLVLCAMKVAATVFSYSSGGAGGIFAPSLFIGGMLGGAVGSLDVYLFHHEPDSVGAFALVGMGAVFSGIIRAPMTSVLIIVEMTSGYSLILPLMIANMTAYGLARQVRPTPVYDALLEQDGIHLREKAVVDVLEGVALRDVALSRAPLVSFTPTTLGRDLMAIDGEQEVYPILDPSGALVGVITREDLELLAAEPGLELLVSAGDVMRPPISVAEDDDLHTAFERMLANGLRRLPVVDAALRVRGSIDESAIANAYLRGSTARPVSGPTEGRHRSPLASVP